MIPDTAMIFAAGFGTRMGDLTQDTPKPMLPVNGRPMIDHSIDLLRAAGIQRIVANTHYLPEALTAHLKTRDVQPVHETDILDTGGGLKAAQPLLGYGPVITMNPDAVWTGPNPVNRLLETWTPDMSGLLMLTDAGKSDDDFSLEQGQIRRKGPFRYTGLQVIRTDLLRDMNCSVFSLNAYWDRLLSSHVLHGTLFPGTWTDIGTKEALRAVNEAPPL
ncbi:MAG: nucleotidyltransferase family protein [Paracoccaceae bacterium]